jgi:hypothetical protein
MHIEKSNTTQILVRRSCCLVANMPSNANYSPILEWKNLTQLKWYLRITLPDAMKSNGEHGTFPSSSLKCSWTLLCDIVRWCSASIQSWYRSPWPTSCDLAPHPQSCQLTRTWIIGARRGSKMLRMKSLGRRWTRWACIIDSAFVIAASLLESCSA